MDFYDLVEDVLGPEDSPQTERPERLLTVADVADLLGTSADEVRGYLTCGLLRGRKIRNRWRISQTDATAFVREHFIRRIKAALLRSDRRRRLTAAHQRILREEAEKIAAEMQAAVLRSLLATIQSMLSGGR